MPGGRSAISILGTTRAAKRFSLRRAGSSSAPSAIRSAEQLVARGFVTCRGPCA